MDTPNTMVAWSELRGAEVYGLARSYIENGGALADPSRVPWFYRGPFERTAASSDDMVASGALTISEEIELVLVLERGADGFAATGFSFGNDLTDLGLFKADNALIQRAKSLQASIAQGWWRGPAPAHQSVTVTATEPDGSQRHYEGCLGTAHICMPVDELERLCNALPTHPDCEAVLLYTGAIRGFAWTDRPISGTTRLQVADASGTLLLDNLVVD